MIDDGNQPYNLTSANTANGDSSFRFTEAAVLAEAALATTTKTPRFQKSRSLTHKPSRRHLAFLAERVGYLQVETFSHRHVLDAMPKRSFGPNEVIACVVFCA